MAKKPIGQSPRRVPFQDDKYDLNKHWGLYFEQLRRNVYDIRDVEVTVDPASVGATTTSEQSFTANDIATDDAILSVNKPTDTTGLFVAGARAGDQKVFLTFANVTGSSINAGSETYLITVLKR